MHWLKDRSNFPPPRPGHGGIKGVCGRDIQDKIGLSQSTTSSYLARLEQADLIISERHGQWTFFRRNEHAIKRFCDAICDELSPGHQLHSPREERASGRNTDLPGS